MFRFLYKIVRWIEKRIYSIPKQASIAVKRGDIEWLEDLCVSHKFEINNQYLAKRLLQRAIENGQIKMIEFLLANDMNVDINLENVKNFIKHIKKLDQNKRKELYDSLAYIPRTQKPLDTLQKLLQICYEIYRDNGPNSYSSKHQQIIEEITGVLEKKIQELHTSIKTSYEKKLGQENLTEQDRSLALREKIPELFELLESKVSGVNIDINFETVKNFLKSIQKLSDSEREGLYNFLTSLPWEVKTLEKLKGVLRFCYEISQDESYKSFFNEHQKITELMVKGLEYQIQKSYDGIRDIYEKGLEQSNITREDKELIRFLPEGRELIESFNREKTKPIYTKILSILQDKTPEFFEFLKTTINNQLSSQGETSGFEESKSYSVEDFFIDLRDNQRRELNKMWQEIASQEGIVIKKGSRVIETIEETLKGMQIDEVKNLLAVADGQQWQQNINQKQKIIGRER